MKRKRKSFLKKRLPENELELIIPDNLKISPADSEAQRLAKKKKVKALKNNFKQKLIEKETKEKQDLWLNFNQKATKQKFGAFAHKKIELFKYPEGLEGKGGFNKIDHNKNNII